MQPGREPFRSVRVEELRRLEMCERALAAAFRRARLPELAMGSERLAAELRARLESLGGTAGAGTDDAWLMGRLADASRLALATYHDHLGDFDPITSALFRDQCIPHHRAALAQLDANAFVESEL